MPKILDNGTFWVYIYANDDNPHHLPHCHVYWDRDDHASVVSLPDLVVIVGEALPSSSAPLPSGECRCPRGCLAAAEPLSRKRQSSISRKRQTSMRGGGNAKELGPGGHAVRVRQVC
jgi:hypothetical protein